MEVRTEEVFLSVNFIMFSVLELQVTFEYIGLDGYSWTMNAINLQTFDQLIYFQTPPFPIHIDHNTDVKIHIKQTKRNLGELLFTYIPQGN